MAISHKPKSATLHRHINACYHKLTSMSSTISPNGFLLIDKPSGLTSHDAVDRVRDLIRANYTLHATPYTLPKVGHAGTLDPFATGLLIIGIGSATKKLGEFMGLSKKYEATLRLGATSDTYDRTGKIEVGGLRDKKIEISNEQLRGVLEKFTGTIEQIPPMYSAKKIKGQKLYELARAGIEIERKPNTVILYSITVVKYASPHLILYVHCSSGTYIRALAHDIGQALGCGAYLEELRRTAIGPFRIEDAMPLDKMTMNDIRSLDVHKGDTP